MHSRASSSSSTCPMMPFSISAIGRVKSRVQRGLGHDAVAVTQVGVDIDRSALGAAGQPAPGHGRAPGDRCPRRRSGIRRDPLRHLMRVVRARQAGANVEELADPCLGSQVPDDADLHARETLAWSYARISSQPDRRPCGRPRSCPCRPASSSRSGPNAERWDQPVRWLLATPESPVIRNTSLSAIHPCGIELNLFA